MPTHEPSLPQKIQGEAKLSETLNIMRILFRSRNFQIAIVSLAVMFMTVGCEASFIHQFHGLLHWVPESFALFFLVRLAREFEMPKKYLILGFMFSMCLPIVSWFKVFLVLLSSSVPVPVTIAYLIFPYAYFGGVFAFTVLLSYGTEKKR